jgi:hypothetical protein
VPTHSRNSRAAQHKLTAPFEETNKPAKQGKRRYGFRRRISRENHTSQTEHCPADTHDCRATAHPRTKEKNPIRRRKTSRKPNHPSSVATGRKPPSHQENQEMARQR